MLTRVLLVLAIVAASGLAGFWGGYASNRSGMLEVFRSFAKVPEFKVADLAYAFATPAQVKGLIDLEPPARFEGLNVRTNVEIMRTLRLAVVAPSSAERQALLAHAQALCEKCKPGSFRGMFQRYAQKRLVPPGDDVVCEDCKPAGRRKALPPVD